MSTATDIADLKEIRSNIIASLKAETAYQVANGPKPSYSIDGESVNWDTWRDSMQRKVIEITEAILQTQGPVMVASRGRP